MMAILGQDANFRTYLLARMLLILGSMGTGFITVFTIERWQLADSVVGFYTAILLLGQTAGNLLSGIIADRAGHKLPLVVGGLCQMLAFAVAWTAATPVWIYVVFAFLGLATGANFVSGMLITMEFPEPSRRPTYIGIANSAIGIALALAPLLGGWVASWGYGWLFAGSALLSLVATAWMHFAVAEPRHVRPVALAAVESVAES
jgi:MFS family permease